MLLPSPKPIRYHEAMRAWLRDYADIPAALGRELARVRLTGARAHEPLRASLSVLLAVVLARAFGMHDVWWAAFSGFAVLRAQLDESLRRGVYRIAGTIVGALLGVAAAGFLFKSALLFLVYVFVCSGVTLTCTLLSRYSYAWLFLGLTNIMVVAFAILEPAQLHAIALLRVADVAIGTVASLIVALLIVLISAPRSVPWRNTVRGVWSAPKPGFAAALTRDARMRLLRHVIEAAFGITLVTALGFWFRLASFSQAAITVLVVMVVPYADFEADRYRAVGRRLALRGLGCFAGGLFGLALLVLTAHVPPLWWVALPVGVWIGEHIQSGDKRVAYFGTQFAFAFLVGFVQESGGQEVVTQHTGGFASNYPAFLRLAGVLTGVVIIAVIFIISHLVSSRLVRHYPKEVKRAQ